MKGAPLTGLRVVAVNYGGSKLAHDDERSIGVFAQSGVYGAAGVPYHIAEPAMPEEKRSPDEPENLGWMNHAIAQEVALAAGQGQAMLLAGGNCTHLTGVVGGLQDVHGADARVGLVFFDAHGDFNTPRTTLTGSLGGMPVAVAAGLAHPRWRELSHIRAPIPTDRIILVDMRNLDPAERALIQATDATVAAVAPRFPGADLAQAVEKLAAKVDLIYLHVDSDVLDGPLVPNHGTREEGGPTLAETLAALEAVFACAKVAAYAVVSVYGHGQGHEIAQASGMALIRGGLAAWARHGMPPGR